MPPPPPPGRFIDSWPMDDEMSLSLIRLWCEVVEDANPLYHDREYAQQSRHGDVIAPPAMIMPLCMRPEWTPHGPVPSTGDMLRGRLPDYPNIAGLSATQVYTRPMRVGERPTIHWFETDPTPEQMTHRGPGRVLTQTYSYRDAAGEEIASHSIEVIRSRPSVTQTLLPTAGGQSDHDVRDPRDVLVRRKADDEALYWDDVHEGDELPPLRIPVTLTRCIKWVAATRDFFDVHHDGDMARRAGEPNLFIGVHFFMALAGRYVTDWTGPKGDVCRLYLRTHGRAYPGDMVQISGRVSRKFLEGDDTRVELDIVCDSGARRTHDGVMTAALPRR
jgi:acyl dehydratase